MKAVKIRLPETESTNDYALALLSRNRPDSSCVIIADYQTQGKGTDTNTWESEKGKNLTFSLILFPEFAADKQFILNKALALGIADFVKTKLPNHRVSIKWPNDIYVDDKKICGILFQNSVVGNRLDYVVAGIGLNVNQTTFKSNAPNPVSLKMLSELDYNTETELDDLLNSIFEKYDQISVKDESQIEGEYHAILYRLMEWHNFIVKDSMVRARITGTNSYGQLLLETETAQLLTCDMKEVKFII